MKFDFKLRHPVVNDHLFNDDFTEEDALEGPRVLTETRQKSIVQRYFEFLEKPTIPTFLSFNFAIAWFIGQPYALGLVWLYAYDMFNDWGKELVYVGFTEERVVNMIMNTLYNLYFQTLGATNTWVDLEAGFEQIEIPPIDWDSILADFGYADQL